MLSVPRTASRNWSLTARRRVGYTGGGDPMTSGRMEASRAGGGIGPDAHVPGAGTARRRPPVKVILFGAVLLGLLGIVALAALREASAPPASVRAARPTLAAP